MQKLNLELFVRLFVHRSEVAAPACLGCSVSLHQLAAQPPDPATGFDSAELEFEPDLAAASKVILLADSETEIVLADPETGTGSVDQNLAVSAVVSESASSDVVADSFVKEQKVFAVIVSLGTANLIELGVTVGLKAIPAKMLAGLAVVVVLNFGRWPDFAEN